VRCTHLIPNAHSSAVTDLALLTDGRVASCAADGVKVWDRSFTHRPAAFLLQPNAHALVGLTDGHIGVASGADGWKLWEIPSSNSSKTEGRSLATHNDHKGAVTCIDGFRDSRVVSGGIDGMARVFDTKGKCVATLDHANPVAASKLPIKEKEKDKAQTVTAPSTATPLPPSTSSSTAAATLSVTSVVVLPAGRLATGGSDGVMRVWDVRAQRLVDCQRVPSAAPMIGDSKSNAAALAIVSLHCLPDDFMLATTSDGILHVYAPKKRSVTTLPLPLGPTQVVALTVVDDY